MDVPIPQSLIDLLGEPFIEYVLGTDDVRIGLSGPQQAMAEQLAGLMTPGVIEESEFARALDLARKFGAYLPDAGQTVANILRLESGSRLPELPKTSDLVLKEIYALLLDIYPVLLLPQRERFGFGPQLSGAAGNHPNREQLHDAIRRDPTLAKLFSEETAHGGWTGNALRSTGSGGTVQLWGFAEQQIRMAWEHARLDIAVPTLSDVGNRLGVNLAIIREAVQGKKATVPIRVGLAGVLLPPAVEELDMGWARLRRVNAQDQTITARTGLEGKLQTTTPTGENVVIDYAGDVIVEFDLPYIVTIKSFDITCGWPKNLQNVMHAMTEKLESLRLGLVLGLDCAEPVNVVTSWQLTLDPLATALSLGWSDTRQVPNLMPRQLTAAEADEWASWAKRVHEHRSPSIAVSVRRLLQAIAERRNPEDVLVDAIIVWENLFGATQESTLRISTSLAWLLGTDADNRKENQKEYKTLYAARSGIVHGSTNVKAEQVPEQSRRAVAISIAALRKVFSERTELLRIGKSEARSIAVMLDKRV